MTRERCYSARGSSKAITGSRVSSWSRRHSRSVNSRRAAGGNAPSANSLLCAKVWRSTLRRSKMQIRDDDVLLIIDVQNDFCPGGALAVADGDAVVPVINRLAELFDHIALTQDWHPPGHSSFATSHPGANPFDSVAMPYGQQTLWPDHCRQGTAGAAFHPKLEIDRAELIIRKGFRPEIDSYSAFFENDRRTPTGLEGYLRDRGLRRVFL